MTKISRGTVAAIFATLCFAPAASAQFVRRRFDPEDLQLEDAGVVHVDLQLGVIRGPNAGRWVVPDFGVDYGLAPNVELGVDGAFALEGTPAEIYAFDHRAGDNVWLSAKIGLFDLEDRQARTAWASGFQLGPKVSAAPDTRGAGFEGLFLVGRTLGRTHLTASLGGFVDPGAQISRGRPTAIEGGLDVDVDLDARNEWSLIGDLSAVYFFSGEPAQLQTTLGPQWAAIDGVLDLSVQALLGILPDNDRYGALLVVSPRVALFR